MFCTSTPGNTYHLDTSKALKHESVDHHRMRLYRRCRIVKRIGILCGFSLELALIRQCTGSTVAEKTVVSDEFDVVSGMTCLNTVNAYSVTIGCITGATSVEIMHREGCVRRDLVEALTTIHGLLYRILVIKDLVPWKQIRKKLLKFNLFKIWEKRVDEPLQIGVTPDARQSPPNLLLKIWLNSNVAVALFVISMPAARPSNIRFRRRIGCDCVEIRTPACALRNISFSSKMPLPPLKMQIPPSLPS